MPLGLRRQIVNAHANRVLCVCVPLELSVHRTCAGVTDIVVPMTVVAGNTGDSAKGSRRKREQGEWGWMNASPGKGVVASPPVAGILERALGEVHTEAAREPSFSPALDGRVNV